MVSKLASKFLTLLILIRYPRVPSRYRWYVRFRWIGRIVQLKYFIKDYLIKSPYKEISFYGEFQHELLCVIPYAYWHHKNGTLKRTSACNFTSQFYFFSPLHQELPHLRTYNENLRHDIPNSPHDLELSKLGYEVYFINPVLRWSFRHLFSFECQRKKETENLFIISYSNNFPIRIIPPLLRLLNDFINGWKLSRIIPRSGKNIFWQFDPFRFVHLFFLGNIQRVYHVVDPYFHLTTDRMIAKRSDLVVIVSEFYRERYQQYNDRILYIPHGIGEEELNYQDQVDMEIGTGYVFLAGTISKDVDLHLLKQVADSIDCQLVIAGRLAIEGRSASLFKTLCEHDRIRFLGEVSAKELKSYIKNSGVCIVPYKKKMKGNVHRTPLKIIHYLAQHKVTIATINFELSKLDNNGIYLADGYDDFVQKVNQALNGELLLNNLLVDDYMDSIRYPKLIQRIVNELP